MVLYRRSLSRRPITMFPTRTQAGNPTTPGRARYPAITRPSRDMNSCVTTVPRSTHMAPGPSANKRASLSLSLIHI